MKRETKLIFSVIINLSVGVLTFLCLIWTIVEANTTNEYGYQSTLDIFKYFTIQSNLISGVVSIIFAVFALRVIKGKSPRIPSVAYVLRLVASAGVGLTMMTVMIYLGPVFGYGLMLSKAVFFYHLFLPLAAILSFIFFDTTDEIAFNKTFFGLLHFAIYAAFYLCVAYTHIVDGKVDLLYDWYAFTSFGIPASALIAVILGALIFGITVLLWKLNAVVHSKQK